MLQSRIVFGLQTCGDLIEGASREWLVADGCGGYASGTVSGLRTRRYHALLVISGSVPGIRHVALAALDPMIEFPSGTRVPLATHEWVSGAVSPDGYRYLSRFDLTDGLPRWRWRVGPVVLERELAMMHGEPTVGVVHRLLAGGPIRLRLSALCTWRDAHGERTASGPPLRTEPVAGGVLVEGRYRLAGPGFVPGGTWYHGAYLREEAARGLTPAEDLWYAGEFVADLEPGGAAEVTAWAVPGAGAAAWAVPGAWAAVPDCGAAVPDGAAAVRNGGGTATAHGSPPPASEIVAAARRRARALLETAGPVDEIDAALVLAADTFVLDGRRFLELPGRRSGAPDVAAGYPWFGSWSRDTMCAYEGLFLCTGRAEAGRELLRGYAGTLRQGLLANTDDSGEPAYTSADATLWFVHAVGRHVAVTGDLDLGAELLPALEEIIEWHNNGTKNAIRVDQADSLLSQGLPGYALTWMDARIGESEVTPRIGKAVEVNALWINALGTVAAMRELLMGCRPATRARRAANGRDWRALADTAAASFRARFPAPAGWLYDVIDGPAGDDPSLRPNQVLAYGLPYAPLRGRRMPEAVPARLLTPLGLRTLTPDAPGYRGRHRGGASDRDSAYHQGTVWPFLIGPYAEARRAAGLPNTGLLDGLAAHLREYGIGSISETADGDPPHGATGCPFQAWSVAEALRTRRALQLSTRDLTAL